MNKPIAEFIGTFTLVLFGCGAAVIAGADIGLTGISFAFGLALIGMAYGIGAVSGCHINPAVTLGVVAAGRMSFGEAIPYIIAQIAGAIVAALLLLFIANGTAGYDVAVNGLGQNGWGEGYLGEYSMTAAFVFEVIATFLFMVVILGATGAGAPAAMAGLAIGLALVVIHLVGINVTGVSVNPARSIGPALFAGATAMSQLWLFIVAPIIGAVLAGLVFKTGMLDGEATDDASDDYAALQAERDALAVNLEACRNRSNSERAAAEKLRADNLELQRRLDIQGTTTQAPAAVAAAPAAAAAPASTGTASKPQGLSAPRGGKGDKLQEINGVGPAMEKLLHSLGYYHFDQIASWTPSEVAWVDDNLEGFKGRATRDDWIAQAKVLARG
jgi:aquaporin Z